MAQSTPTGVTPPTPNLDREEPDFWIEDDIPSDDGGPADRAAASRDEPERNHKPERE